MWPRYVADKASFSSFSSPQLHNLIPSSHHNLCYASKTSCGPLKWIRREADAFLVGHFFLGPGPWLCSPCSCTNSGASTGKGRRERMTCGLQEPSLSRLKQTCQYMCIHSLYGSLITPLLWMFSFWNFPSACLPTETDQSLGTCFCFLYFCFYFSSWSVTRLYCHSGSNKKVSLEFLQKRPSWCSQFAIYWGFVVGFYQLFFLSDSWILR